MARVDPEARQATVNRLLALRAEGALTTAHVQQAADGLGVSQRTVWRWIGPSERSSSPTAYRPTETDLAAYAYFRGNVAAVTRARDAVIAGKPVAAGVPIPEFLRTGWSDAKSAGERTLQRAFEAALTPAERAAWRDGDRARRAAEVYLRRADAGRNQVWELDHKQLPVLVMPPRGGAVKPWLTTIIDDGSRALVGWVISLTPHTGTVLTALRMALTHDPERGPFGAVPAMVRIDRGLDFAAEAVRGALAALCVVCHRLPGYTPHRKGKVERIHRTIEQTFLIGLPGFTGGPRDAAGRLYGPVSDSTADRAAAEGATAAPLPVALLATRFAAWVSWYNSEREHSGLGDRTPVQAWNDDDTTLQRIDEVDLRHLLLAGAERTIGADGIRFGGHAYLAPELHGRRGQRVQVRYMPHDDRFIEVYLDDKHLCTAHPQDQLTPEQVAEFRAAAKEEAKRLAAARRRAARRARTELVPLDGTAAPEESRLVPQRHGTEQAGRQTDTALRRRARADLLGLSRPAALRPDQTEGPS
ncbi:Mu transposase C-terminal domain-containing protein [Glycomyces rhizosphaerae]|uniref:Mu transposase C-terminal domain-containing protein n=1 Tax=Glycomyces rhizosphaerae TaxID=2054422 RepID=A0ABV7Q6S8_9ACTN